MPKRPRAEAASSERRQDDRLGSQRSSKRPRHDVEAGVSAIGGQRKGRATLEGALSEELLVRIMSFLDVQDVVMMARLSSAWHRLAQEPQLWRSLYLSTYATSRVAPPQSPFARQRPWRELYKISTNWRRGSAKPTLLQKAVRQSVLPAGPAPIEPPSLPAQTLRPLRPRPSRPDTVLQFHHHLFLSAPTTPPPGERHSTVSIYQASPTGGPTLLLGSVVSSAVLNSRSRDQIGVTEMRLDGNPSASTSSLKLAVFYSSGQSAIFQVGLPTATSPLDVAEIFTSPPPSHTAWADKVLHAQLHSPLLVTFSATYTLRFYRMFTPSRPGAAMELHEIHASLRAQEMWWPATLTLEPVSPSAILAPAENPHLWPSSTPLCKTPLSSSTCAGFTVTLAYATPLLQRMWSVGMQQFDISADGHVLTAYRTLTPPTGPPGGGGGLVTALEHRGRFLVASRDDNTLDVYEIATGGVKSDRLVHRRTLFGHTATVCSVAVDSTARAVSGGADGEIKVWDLDPDTHAEAVTIRDRALVEGDVDSALIEDEDPGWSSRGGRPNAVKQVMFDESKIVSIVASSDPDEPDAVKLLRFD